MSLPSEDQAYHKDQEEGPAPSSFFAPKPPGIAVSLVLPYPHCLVPSPQLARFLSAYLARFAAPFLFAVLFHRSDVRRFAWPTAPDRTAPKYEALDLSSCSQQQTLLLGACP